MAAFPAINIGKNTLTVLKVAASINPSILVKAGNEIRSLSQSGSVFMEAKIDETFPSEFAIYELNRLLSVLNSSAMTGAELRFEDDKDFMVVAAGNAKVNYHFSDPSFVKYKDTTIPVDNVNAEVLLTDTQISEIRKMSGILGHTHIKFKVRAGSIQLVCTNPDMTVANDFSIDLSKNEENFADGEFSIKLENLLLVEGNYKVVIFKGIVSKWIHESGNVDIFIGLEMK